MNQILFKLTIRIKARSNLLHQKQNLTPLLKMQLTTKFKQPAIVLDTAKGEGLQFQWLKYSEYGHLIQQLMHQLKVTYFAQSFLAD